MEVTRRVLFYLSLFTLIVFSTAGYLIVHFFIEDKSLLDMLGKHYVEQIGYGLAYGLAIGLIGISAVETPYLRPVTAFFRGLFNRSKINLLDVLFASLSAGIGEELLFRGGLQYFFGIWLTSIFFVAIHGYLSPKNPRMFVYGFLMIFFSAGLGYLADYKGLVAAMTAHALFDILIFCHLLYRK